MRKNIVAGNWKMNKNLQEGIALAKELNEALAADKPNCDVVICTPFIHLASVTPIVDKAVIGVGAENCADKVSGAYTGEVSAEMVASTGAEYVILGHSERRALPEMTFELFEQDARDILNHKIPNDLENWVSEKALAAFKKRIPDIEELETYLRKWKMSLCMENAVVKNIGVRPHEIHIKKIKQNQKFYKRNIKYLVKAYHK